MTFLPFLWVLNRNSEFPQTTARMMNGMCLTRRPIKSTLLKVSMRGGVINEIAYFLVTNVEHSVINSAATYKEDDLYTGSTLGELGCWVDPSFTRTMQTGLEHARIPDVGSYLELGMTPLCLSLLITNSHPKAYNKLDRRTHLSNVVPLHTYSAGSLLSENCYL
jgi:hypothetical protein